MDGVSSAVLLAQALVRMGLRPTRGGEYAAAPAKQHVGLLREFGRRTLLLRGL